MGQAERDERTRVTDNRGSVWLLTFNDMMTLLLTFFVLLLSMSRMDAARMEEISGAVGSAFGLPGPEEKASVRVFDPFILPPEAFPSGGRQERDEKAFERFILKRDDFIRRCSAQGRLTARAAADGVWIGMGASLVFPEGEVRLAGEGIAYLLAVCSLMEGARPRVRVTVFTEETPADRERHPTGWELAAARGAGVAQFLSSRGGVEPERISVSAYGVMKPAAAKAGGISGARGGVLEVAVTFYES